MLFRSLKSHSLKQQVANQYIKGLEWNFQYYTNQCPDWRWTYGFNYPPLLADLVQQPTSSTFANPRYNPVTEQVQLCYVLPKIRDSLSLLEPSVAEKVKHLFQTEPSVQDFVWAYCQFFWESHVVSDPPLKLDDLF